MISNDGVCYRDSIDMFMHHKFGVNKFWLLVMTKGMLVLRIIECRHTEYKKFWYYSFTKIQKSPQSLRLFLMMTSVTASKTNWILVVSVAHVKWVYTSFWSLRLFKFSNFILMYSAESSYVAGPTKHENFHYNLSYVWPNDQTKFTKSRN